MLRHRRVRAPVRAKVWVTRKFPVTRLRQMMLDPPSQLLAEHRTVLHPSGRGVCPRYLPPVTRPVVAGLSSQVSCALVPRPQALGAHDRGSGCGSAILFVRTLPRPYLPDVIPFTKASQAPASRVIQDEATLLIDSASNLRWMKQRSYLFTGIENSRRADVPVADEVSGRLASQNAMPAESCTRSFPAEIADTAICAKPLARWTYGDWMPPAES